MKSLTKKQITKIIALVRRGSKLTPKQITNILTKEGYQVALADVKSWLTCKVDGCERTNQTAGYCWKHYHRFRKYGDPSIVRKNGRKQTNIGLCKAPGCTSKSSKAGYCNNHYMRVYRYGDVDIVNKAGRKPLYSNQTCKVVGCESNVYAKGYCSKHYRRNRAWGDPHYVATSGKKSYSYLEKVNKNKD